MHPQAPGPPIRRIPPSERLYRWTFWAKDVLEAAGVSPTLGMESELNGEDEQLHLQMETLSAPESHMSQGLLCFGECKYVFLGG